MYLPVQGGVAIQRGWRAKDLAAILVAVVDAVRLLYVVEIVLTIIVDEEGVAGVATAAATTALITMPSAEGENYINSILPSRINEDYCRSTVLWLSNHAVRGKREGEWWTERMEIARLRQQKIRRMDGIRRPLTHNPQALYECDF